MGINSALHIIIFDELDAICRQRGTLSGSTGVHDTVVNQLLAKVIDQFEYPWRVDGREGWGCVGGSGMSVWGCTSIVRKLVL